MRMSVISTFHLENCRQESANAFAWCAQIEDHYVTLLSITGPFGRTPTSLLKVLSSLHGFLQASQPAASPQEKASELEDDTWQWGRPRASSLHANKSAVGPKNRERWPKDGESVMGKSTCVASFSAPNISLRDQSVGFDNSAPTIPLCFISVGKRHYGRLETM